MSSLCPVDDLTWTFDTDAAVTGLCAPSPVAVPEILSGSLPGFSAMESGTREQGTQDAARTTTGMSARLIGAAIRTSIHQGGAFDRGGRGGANKGSPIAVIEFAEKLAATRQAA